jgi:probable phosphoglycerate mutase
MFLHVVRHGRTASNVAGLLDTAHPGSPLDDVGLAQAEALVERFAETAVDAVYASDILRAVQTGTPLAAARGLALVELAGAREILAGDQELSSDWVPYVDMLRAWGTGRPTDLRPGGEDGVAFFGRFDAAVAGIADAGHEAAVLVTHGAAMRMWLAARVSGLAPADVIERRLGNTAVISLQGGPGDWRLVSWDDGVLLDANSVT